MDAYLASLFIVREVSCSGESPGGVRLGGCRGWVLRVVLTLRPCLLSGRYPVLGESPGGVRLTWIRMLWTLKIKLQYNTTRLHLSVQRHPGGHHPFTIRKFKFRLKAVCTKVNLPEHQEECGTLSVWCRTPRTWVKLT